MEAPVISPALLATYAGDAAKEVNLDVASVDVVAERVGTPPAKQ